LSACSRLFQLVKYNIEKAKKHKPKAKRDTGLNLVWGATFLFGGGLAYAWLRPWEVPQTGLFRVTV